MLKQFLKSCGPWVGTHVKAVHEELYPMEGTLCSGAVEKFEEEGVSEKCYGLTASPIPHPPGTAQQWGKR